APAAIGDNSTAMAYSILTVTVTPFAQNCRILFDERAREALVIDPGGDADRILDEVSKRGLSIKEIWLTHSHLDHCGAVRAINKPSGAPLTAHPAEQMMRAHVTDIAAMYGAPDGFENCPEPDRTVKGGETVPFAGAHFKVLFTPGHSPGHVCFYDAASG